ncbi:MAG: hypothetical protein L0387_29735 [Acidobacteria bacterium]|nr:hypothetical protein [Acidobacteriota bacterium]MCI0722174.1 hypothetical protein [Acidobacteriota bacterium]
MQCHPKLKGEMTPMPLTTYQEVRPWAAAIKEAVLLRRMPPWYVEAPRGHFANDWRLAPDEIEKIRRLVEARAPQGSPDELPGSSRRLRKLRTRSLRSRPNVRISDVPTTGMPRPRNFSVPAMLRLCPGITGEHITSFLEHV